MKTGSKCLTFTQRLIIEQMLNAKFKQADIAAKIGVSPSTVSREIKRGTVTQRKIKKDIYGDQAGYIYYEVYSADEAERKYRYNLTSKGKGLKLGADYAFIQYIEKRVLEDILTPHAVLGEMRRKHPEKLQISLPTLYKYIRMGLFPHIIMDEKKVVHYEHATVKRAPRGTSIEQRPAEIGKRNEFGHWEMDCVCGPTKDCLLAFTERLTRKEILSKIPNQKAESVIHCLNVLERKYGKMFRSIFKTITVDNGSEFSDCKAMQLSSFGKGQRVQIYYCHPYSAYERGSNERMNREIRRRFPKGTNFSKVSIEDVQKVEHWLNRYPRSVLNYDNAEELFDRQLANL